MRAEIIDEAADEDVALDIRDDQYLIAQLSKPGSPIFARFFGSIEEQLTTLLDRPDPLRVADTRLKHALLATLGAYVFLPRARLARGTLFQKTVLAALAAAGGRAQPQVLLGEVKTLLPDEAVDRERLSAAIGDLQSQGLCVQDGDEIVCRGHVLEQFVSVSRAATNGYQALMDAVVSECKRWQQLDDAQLGYLERNVRRTLLVLFRAAGPLPDATGLADAAVPFGPDVRNTLVKDLPTQVGQAALTALAAFVQAQESASLLAPLVRAYAALAIRNIDPVGRRWQQLVLSRSSLALDTDAVLNLLVEDLPEHRPLLMAVRALRAQGVRLLVSPRVIEEVVGHVERADRSFRRFADTLLRLPEAAVDGGVWHAVVRGYYYASRKGYTGSPEDYRRRFYDAKRPAEFIRHVLSQRVTLHEEDLETIPDAWESDSQELEASVLELKERSRWKAGFRDDTEMQQRARADVRMILHLAVRADSSLAAAARGYLASEDRAFVLIERHQAWRDRGHVLMMTRGLPELAAFVCGTEINDDELVRLLFDPAIAVAADHLATEIGDLAAVGVDLRETPLTRLEWDVSRQLNEYLHELKEAVASSAPDAEERSARAVVATAQAAEAAGYSLAEPVARLAASYDALATVAKSERRKREEIEEKLRALAGAVRGRKGRGRRRANRILRELGIELEVTEGSDDDGEM